MKMNVGELLSLINTNPHFYPKRQMLSNDP
jgi:hypothetical protein